MPIYDSSRPEKLAHYIPDPLQATISIISNNYDGTLTAHFYSSPIHFPTSDGPEMNCIMMRYRYDCKKT